MNKDYKKYARMKIKVAYSNGKPYADSDIVSNDAEIPTASKRDYYKKVWEITESQALETLENSDKRGFHNYQLDHIIPISYGFRNDIAPEIIGNISNLRFIHWKENLLKAAKYKGKSPENYQLKIL